MSQITWLGPQDPFPTPSHNTDPDANVPGLIAVSDRIYPGQLLQAYQKGIFPWYSDNQPVLWWSPDPRMVLNTQHFQLHRSFRKTLQKFVNDPECEIRIDHDFSSVIRHCASTPRKGQPGTWIVDDMIQAYEALHQAGYAHSVETWSQGRMIGGLYCVSIGDTLFGESMFAHQTDASKIALAALVAFARTQDLAWIDCQQNTSHLASFGAREVPRSQFLTWVRGAPKISDRNWTFDPSSWHTVIPMKEDL